MNPRVHEGDSERLRIYHLQGRGGCWDASNLGVQEELVLGTIEDCQAPYCQISNRGESFFEGNQLVKVCVDVEEAHALLRERVDVSLLIHHD
jgi:hypothetical protein